MLNFLLGLTEASKKTMFTKVMIKLSKDDVVFQTLFTRIYTGNIKQGEGYSTYDKKYIIICII